MTRVMECDGCGSRKSREQIQRGGHLSCCPERRMIEVEDDAVPPHEAAGWDLAAELNDRLRRDEDWSEVPPELRVWLANRITEAVNAARDAPARQEEGSRGDAVKAACEPWKFGVGDPPDDGSPLIGPYSAGIGYAIDRLAKLTDAGQYVGADGSETFEGDVDGTIMNALRAARLYDDETGEFGKIPTLDANSGGEAVDDPPPSA